MSSDLYVSAPALNAIIRTDMDRDGMSIVASGLRGPGGIVFAPDGTLFVAETGGGCVSVLEKSGKTREHVSGLSRPAGMAIDTNGNLYVACAGSDSIEVIATDGTRRTLATGAGRPQFLAFDGTRYLYADAGSNRQVNRFDLNGARSEFHVLNQAATGIACDRDGNVYWSGEYDDRRTPYIVRFDTAHNGAVLIRGERAGRLTVLGYTNNGYLIYSFLGTVVVTFRTEEWSFVRRSAWAEYAAVPPDFSYPS